MYSRNMRNGVRTVPPGYVGSAFSDEIGVKYHEPEHEIAAQPERQEIYDNAALPVGEKEVGEQNALSDLIRAFRGKLGTEELIILIVMLLVSSEGVRFETVILALVLLSR